MTFRNLQKKVWILKRLLKTKETNCAIEMHRLVHIVLESCYTKCLKTFFGYHKHMYSSVTGIQRAFNRSLTLVDRSIVLVQSNTPEVWCTLPSYYLADNDLWHPKAQTYWAGAARDQDHSQQTLAYAWSHKVTYVYKEKFGGEWQSCTSRQAWSYVCKHTVDTWHRKARTCSSPSWSFLVKMKNSLKYSSMSTSVSSLSSSALSQSAKNLSTTSPSAILLLSETLHVCDTFCWTPWFNISRFWLQLQKASGSSGKYSSKFPMHFLPRPSKDDTVSHPVNAWKSALQRSLPKISTSA